MGVETAITAGTSLLGAGASLVGGSNASSAAESASEDAQANAQNNALMALMGFYGSKYTLEDAAKQAADSYYYGPVDQNTAKDNALAALAGNTGVWNQAYDRGSAAINSGLSEWDNKYNQVRADEQPYMDFGRVGLTGYTGLLEDPSSITSNPGYQFRLDQGVQSLDRSAAAKGKLFSGAQGKAVTEYGQNYATSEYDKALERYKYAIGVGQTSTGRVDQAGMTTAAGKASLYNNPANLGVSTATGQSNNNNNIANVWQGWGDDRYRIANDFAGNENSLAKNIVSAWQAALDDMNGSTTAGTNASNEASMTAANAQNQGLEGAANSLNTGLSNYLKSSDSKNASSYATNFTFPTQTTGLGGYKY